MSCTPRDLAQNTGPSIGTLKEKSLHAGLKAWYARPGDALEARVDGYVIDIVRDDLLVEVQTGNLGALRGKLQHLLANHRIVLIYPIAVSKGIVRVAPPKEGQLARQVISRRRSPKRGQLLDAFDELVRIPQVLAHPNLTLELVLCEIDELRCDDGAGSWRRQGVSILDQELVRVLQTVRIGAPADLLSLLPSSLVDPFTNRHLADAAGVRLRLAQRITYTLCQMGVLASAGHEGRARLFRRCPS